MLLVSWFEGGDLAVELVIVLVEGILFLLLVLIFYNVVRHFNIKKIGDEFEFVSKFLLRVNHEV